jgi:hypothetical protein
LIDLNLKERKKTHKKKQKTKTSSILNKKWLLRLVEIISILENQYSFFYLIILPAVTASLFNYDIALWNCIKTISSTTIYKN